MSNLTIAAVAVFAVMTVITFLMFAIDKSKAKRGKRRISEAALLTASFLMGGVGGLLGMLICRHKTKHWYFCLLVPIFAVLSVGAVVLTYIYCG